MDLSFFQRLGERVDQAYRRSNFDDFTLPQIASEALTDTQLPKFDFQPIGEFIRRNAVPQDPGSEFSDLPVIVYDQPEFYIQLLIWNTSTTAIHQHAFSGAFAVLSGSSIHTRYTFEEQHRISSLLFQGKIHFQHIELLKKGDVREIVPGRMGLFHALFHLDRPSVTVVIRTPKTPEAFPQLSIARPHFAFAPFELRADAKVRMLQRLAQTMLEAEDAGLSRVLLEQIPRLDFPRIFMFHQTIYRLLDKPSDREQLIAGIREHHGHLADHLADVAEVHQTEQRLKEARQHTSDPELRFFLALLLNAPSRPAIYSMIQEAYADKNPEARCARWLAKLADPKTIVDELVRRGSKRRAQTLVERLTAALPCAGESGASESVQALLAAAGQWSISALTEQHPTAKVAGESDHLSKQCHQLHALPELAPLFTE